MSLRERYRKHRKIVKPAIIVLAVLLYWVLIYYPFHYSAFTPVSAIAAGTILLVLGIYSLFIKGDVKFKHIKPVYFIFLALMIISDIGLLIASLKHGLTPEVDITISFIYRNFGLFTAIIANMLGYLAAIVAMAATYKLLDREHFYLWIMIFLAWTVSTVKLFVGFVFH